MSRLVALVVAGVVALTMVVVPSVGHAGEMPDSGDGRIFNVVLASFEVAPPGSTGGATGSIELSRNHEAHPATFEGLWLVPGPQDAVLSWTSGTWQHLLGDDVLVNLMYVDQRGAPYELSIFGEVHRDPIGGWAHRWFPRFIPELYDIFIGRYTLYPTDDMYLPRASGAAQGMIQNNR